MTRERAVLTQVRTAIVGVTPPTSYDGRVAFAYADRDSADDVSARAMTRQFHLELSGDWAWSGDQAASSYGASVDVGVDVVMTYRRQASLFDFLCVVLEDVRAIYQALSAATAYDAETTGMWRIQPQTFDVVGGDRINDLAIVTMPIIITFDPE